MFKGYIIEQLIRERKIKKADVYRYADIQKATLDNKRDKRSKLQYIRENC